MPYTLTPAERRARAQAVMRQRENRYALTNYITSQKRAAAERAEQINQAKIEAETEKNRQGFFTRAFHTIGDLAANVLTGAVKGLEGIYDFGAGIVGGIGGLFDKDFQNSVKKSIAYDWTGETIGKPLQEATKYSYLTDGGLVEQVASGVGQMLPAVAVSVATGGLGAPAAIAQGSSLATLGLSAAGNSTEEAFQDGADYGAGLLYGAASGAVEVATEKMWGGFGKLTGGGFLDNVGKSVASTGLRRVAKEAVQEGIEEVVAEVANPALKAIYKGGSALEEYKDPEYWKRVGEAGLVGGLTSVVYGGTVGKVIDTTKGTNQDIGDSLDEVENLRKKRNNLFVNDRLTAENEARIDENLRANYANIERVLQKSSENTRAKYIKTYNLSEAFEADGTMKSDFAVHLGITPAAAQTNTEGGEAAHTPLASLDKRYYHPSLRGQEQRIAESLARQGTRVFSGELTETEQANYTKFKKAFNALAQKGLVEPDFVVAETTDKFYSYIDGKTVVLGKDVFESDAWQKKLIHETTHFAEGTKEWVDYANFILSQTDTSDAIASILQKKYGITQADVDTLQDAIQRDELTDNHRLLLSEIMAMQSENLFGNEAMIAKLTQERRGLARRIFDKIKNFIKVLKAKSPEEKTVIKKLETAQKLFEKALGRAGTEYLQESAAQILDTQTNVRYNENAAAVKAARKPVQYIAYNKIGSENVRQIRGRLNQIYEGVGNSVADGIAIENGKTVYIVDSGKEEGSIRFGIRKQLTLSDDALRAEYIRRANNDAISKGYVSNELSSKFGDKHYNDRGGNRGQELGEELSAHKEQSSNSERAVSQSDESRGRELKYSLKDAGYYETEEGSKIALAMDMTTCKQMIERLYRIVDPNQYEESPIYKNAEDWLAKVGASEVALYADNERMIHEKYLSKIPAMDEGEITTEQVIEAYHQGALRGSIVKDKAVRLNTSEGVDSSDTRFYAPQKVEDAKGAYKIATQKITNANRAEVLKARAQVLIFAHNRGAVEELGITRSELNKKLRSWTNYSETARTLSMRVNDGVAFSNMWTGIENSTYLYNATVSEEDFAQLVGKIEGSSTEYERRYIASTMLALDTHIDYSGLNFIFGAKFESGSVRGEYSDSTRTIKVRRGTGVSTVAHEMGHAIDHQWYRDIWKFVGKESSLSEGLTEANVNLSVVSDPEVVQWVKNFKAFVDDISDVSSISSEYYQRKSEVFARFVGQFVEWTMQTATGRDQSFGYTSWKIDSFKPSQYTEFIKILQEKAKLDSKYAETQEKPQVKFSRKDSEYTAGQYENFGWVRANDVLSSRQWTDFNSKFTQAKKGTGQFVKTAGGGFIIPVNDMTGNSFGVDNVLVYAKGTIENPKIVKIVKINLESETDIDIVRSYIYGEESSSNTQASSFAQSYFGQEIVREYTARDFRDYQEYQRNARARSGGTESRGIDGSYQQQQNGRGDPQSDRSDVNENIRYSRKDGSPFYTLTDGQVKKLLANHSRFKVYSKFEAEDIINTVLSGDYMSFQDKYGVISGKAKAEVVDMLWRKLNTANSGERMKVALDIAEYIIKNSAVESIWGDEDMQDSINIVDALKPYLHSLNLNGIKGEIGYRYGKDNSPYALWGKPKGEKGIGADQLALILEEKGIHVDASNEADIFFEIDAAYRKARAALRTKTKEMLSTVLTKKELRQLQQDIANEVLQGFETKGEPSKYAAFIKRFRKALVEKYRKRALVWKEKYLNAKEKNRLENRILDKAQKFRDIKYGTFLNASQFKSDVFKGSIEKLAGIKNRGNLSAVSTRKILGGLREWYVETNPLLAGVYDNDIAALLEIISSREGKLSVDELRALENVVDHFKHIIETYNKVYRNGAYVEAQPIAEGYIETLRANKGVQVGWFARLTDRIFNNDKVSYFQIFGDPLSVARRMDMYEDGFYTQMIPVILEGEYMSGIEEMEMRAPMDEFLKAHKKYLKELGKRTMGYGGQTIPAAQAISLYMTLNREQALRGLMESGFTYESRDGQQVRFDGIAPGEELTTEEMKARAAEVQKELFKQFTEADKAYISIADHIFNEVAKEAKRRTDLLRLGYSNVLDDYYFPIRRAFVAHSVDTSTYIDEMKRVSNASFNKDTVKGAKNELYIEPIDRVLDRHIHAVAQYANLALAIDEYNKIYNLDIGDNPNKPTSVKTESVDVWKRGDEYFKKLISDIQGIPTSKGAGRKIMGYIRGSYAKFQLGANPKVWVTQLSSLAAAGSILDVSSITRGIGMRVSDAEVDQYCPLAKLRNNENTVAMAQGIIEKVDRVSGVLMTPIGKVDRFVVKRLFGACQVQVEKNGGAKVGTEENKVKAGELLKKVILETQQNTFSASRSAAMRSDSELMKTVTMFSSDAMKVVGRVIDSIGEVAVLRAKLKAETDAGVREKLSARLKTANRKARKSVASLVASAAFMALIAQVFRWLYKKDDEDENIAKNMLVDFIGNLFGGLPLIKDIYARFMEGYDLDNYAYSAINELFDSAENVFNLIGDMASGNMDSKDIAGVLKSLFFSAGQMFGIPTRNMYNVVNGLTKRISPTSAYKVDSMLYDQNYRADLNSAIERGDDVMVATIVGIMLDENIGEVTNSNARKELDRLVKAGYNVIPRSVGKTIVYDGEETALSTRQVGEFKQVYSVANKALASLVGLSQYQEADDDVKAKAVNFIYNTYYNLAVEDFVGVELESKNTLFAEAIDIEKLAIIIAMARSIVADTDKRGNAISGSRKAKIQAYINSLRLTAAQKYMIMGYLGYTNTKGEAQVNAYINRLSLSKNEKAKLLQYSGYAA